jgi:hypothetical protein
LEVKMKVLVCGGRDYDDDVKVFETLDRVNVEKDIIDVIISGQARGADTIGEWYAKDRGLEIDKYPAQWNKYGKSAGYKRNTQMLVEGKPDLVVAFPGGRGTAMMVKIAKDAGVEVMEVT